MAGNSEGAKKAARTVWRRYGRDFHKVNGRVGGQKSRGGGFSDPEVARRAGKWKRETRSE